MNTVNTGKAINDIAAYMRLVGEGAKMAAQTLARSGTATKNSALLAAAAEIDANIAGILAANAIDVSRAGEAGHDAAFVDRLTLVEKSIRAMAAGLREVAALGDPVGQISDLNFRPSGIQVGKMRVPLGVIGMIYESRPNVTADAAALCLKSGNACILRGGAEALVSNRAIHDCLVRGVVAVGLPATAVQLIATTDRAAVGEMLNMSGVIDVIIPRGGKSLTARIAEHSRVPVIKHLDGICHVYIDDTSAPVPLKVPCNGSVTIM